MTTHWGENDSSDKKRKNCEKMHGEYCTIKIFVVHLQRN